MGCSSSAILVLGLWDRGAPSGSGHHTEDRDLGAGGQSG